MGQPRPGPRLLEILTFTAKTLVPHLEELLVHIENNSEGLDEHIFWGTTFDRLPSQSMKSSTPPRLHEPNPSFFGHISDCYWQIRELFNRIHTFFFLCFYEHSLEMSPPSPRQWYPWILS